MRALHLFSGSGHLNQTLSDKGFEVVSLDMFVKSPDGFFHYNIDFLEFDFKFFNPVHFDVIFVAFPCNTFSKASNGFHFWNKFLPKTDQGKKAIKMLQQMKKLLNHFSKAIFVIENPTSALFSNFWFDFYFQSSHLKFYRLNQFNYGHPTAKQTDLCTNSDLLMLVERCYRVNGKIASVKLCNLSLKNRQAYPLEFSKFLSQYLSDSVTITKNQNHA